MVTSTMPTTLGESEETPGRQWFFSLDAIWYEGGMGLVGGCSYPDIVVVLQAILHMVQELTDVQLAQAALKQ